MKMAMIKIHQELRATSYILHTNARMLLQVHDELVFEIKEDQVTEIAPKIKSIMETVHTFKVPILVELKTGKNWGELSPFSSP